MRLLFDAHHLGRRETGNETWTRNMAWALDRVAAPGEVHVAVTRLGRAELGGLTAAPAHLVATGSARRLALDLPRAARASRCSVVLAYWTAPATRTPCVLFVPDLSLWDPRAAEWLPWGFRVSHRAAVHASVARAAAVVVLSEHARQGLAALAGVGAARPPVAVVPGAVDRGLAALLQRTAAAPAAAGRFRVLAVGTVVPRKNLAVLARAVRACREGGRDVHLRLVGPVPAHGQAVAQEVRALLGPAVTTTEYVSPERLAAEYASADAFCFPSLFEGFGLPVLEAMTAGVPAVVSTATALPEVAGGAALTADPHDAGAWARAIAALADDAGLRRKLAGQGAERARTFSWERSASQLLDVARGVAAEHGAAPVRVRGRRG